MKRIKLEVAFDGTAYCGWQQQPNGITIEAVLNRVLSDLLKEEIKVTGASRTDAGVHALAAVCVFDTRARMPADKISFALNQRLPDDIRIQSSGEVAADFHPRRCSSVKTYEYRILNRTFQIPTERLYAYHVYVPLDLVKMQRAAAYLIGEHDFKSFASIHTEVETTVRTIYSLDLIKEGDMIRIRIKGSGFLYNMVRIIAGTLLEVGRGKILPEDLKTILAATDRSAAGPTAPAHGLMLVKIDYDIENRENSIKK